MAKLHKAFENTLRLQIMSVLIANPQYDFNAFKDVLEVTDGNLASHLRNLEKNNFIEVIKSFKGRKPLTQYRASPKGKAAFEEHLRALEKIIKMQQ